MLQNLAESFEKEYGRAVKRIWEDGGRIWLDDGRRLYEVRRVSEADRKRVSFAYQAGRWLAQNDFTDFAEVCLTNAKHTVIRYRGSYYVFLQRPMSERLHTFYNETPASAKEKAAVLARFHKTGKGFECPKRLRATFDKSGKWFQFAESRCRDFETFRDQRAEEGDDDQTRFVLEHFTYVRQWGESASRYMEDNGYEAYAANHADRKTIAHRNNPLSRMETASGSVWLAAPTEWVIDFPFRDVAESLKTMFYTEDRALNQTRTFLREYNRRYRLNSQEWAFVYGQMLFPKDWMRMMMSPAFSAEGKSRWLSQAQTFEAQMRRFPQVVRQETGASIPPVDWLL